MLRAVHRLLPQHLRRLWVLVVALAGLCSLAELATTALLLTVIRLAAQPADAGPRVLLPWVPSTPLVLAGGRAALLATAVVTTVFLLRAVLAVALAVATNASTVATGIALAEALFARYVGMPYVQFRQRRVAELQRRVTVQAKTVVSQVFRPGVQLATDVAIIASVLSMMVVASPVGTLAAAVMALGVGIVLTRAINPRLRRAVMLVEQHDRSANLFVDQALHGRREITLRHHEAPVVSSFVEGRRAGIAPSRRTAILLELPRIVVEGVTMVVVTGLIIFAIGLELDTPRVLALLGLFAYALLRLMPLATRMATNLASVRAGLPVLDEVLQDILAAPGDLGSPARSRHPQTGATPALAGAIEFRQVSARYEGSRDLALHDVTVRVEAGSFVAVVGPSGAGKSTLVDLLVGLIEPTAGQVLVGGQPLAGLVEGWQTRVGVVSQEPYIFNDSVLRNVVLFAGAVDERRVVQVLDDVGLWELARQLPHGLDTEIGDRGSTLSGGQRQRLAVARALYSDPDLLVFDEATSALDPDAETRVLRAALRRPEPRTVLIVTHRASAIRNCSQVIVLEDGAVTASGPYAEVLAKSAYFARLVSAPTPGSFR
jgi:ABC-type multidrug transport system fused ATPase/permease subunit